MIGHAKVLAVVPARGGSKSIPRKNIAEIAGKPLIAYTIEAAKQSKYIDRLIVSSEDAEIIQTAMSFGADAPFVRPVELAQDDTPGVAPVIHALESLPGYDYVVLLQVTSPLRSTEDIDSAIELAVEQNADHCVSVVKPDLSPYWMYTLNNEFMMQPLLEATDVPRQQLPKAVSLNGAVYVSKCTALLETRSFLKGNVIGYLMPKSRSLDVDSPDDLEYLRWKLNNKTADTLST